MAPLKRRGPRVDPEQLTENEKLLYEDVQAMFAAVRWIVVGFAVVAVVFVAIVIMLYTTNRNRVEEANKLAEQNAALIKRTDASSDESHRALCAFRSDLDTRIKAGKDFLKAHPNGIPGISRADIERSLQGQESTLDTLHFLRC